MNFEFSESVSEAVSTMSRQDKQALNIYEESARLVDGHYQIAIPWKCHLLICWTTSRLQSITLTSYERNSWKTLTCIPDIPPSWQTSLIKATLRRYQRTFGIETTGKYGTFRIILWCICKNPKKFMWFSIVQLHTVERRWMHKFYKVLT